MKIIINYINYFFIGCAPAYLSIMMLFVIIYTNYNKRDIKTNAKRKPDRASNIIWDKLDAAETVSNIVILLAKWLGISLFMGQFVYLIFQSFPFLNDNFYNRAADFNGFCISITGVTVTAAVVMISFNKEYYLVFKMKDVLKVERFGGAACIVLTTCVISNLNTYIMLTLKSDTEFVKITIAAEVVILILNILFVAHCFKVIYKVQFSYDKFELKILKSLYKALWGNIEIEIRNTKKWSKSAVSVNSTYLLKDYYRKIMRLKYNNITGLKYAESTELTDLAWYNKAVACIIIFEFMLSVALVLPMIILGPWIVTFTINMATIIILLVLLYLPALRRFFESSIIFLVYGSGGYFIGVQGRKERYVRNIRKGLHFRHHNYVNSLNSLMEFYIIAIYNKTATKADMNYILKEMLSILEDNDIQPRSAYAVSIYYMPVFLAGYLAYVKDIVKDLSPYRDLYLELKLSREEIRRFYWSLSSLIKTLIPQDEQKYNSKLEFCYYFLRTDYWLGITGGEKP